MTQGVYPILWVEDVDSSAAWYETVLEFQVANHGGQFAECRRGACRLGLHPAADLAPWAGKEAQAKGVGMEMVLSIDGLDAFYSRLEASGRAEIVSPLREHAEAGLLEFKVRDPDGFLLSFQASVPIHA